MSPGPRPLVLGRVAGHRGSAGEVTVRVASGDAVRWTDLRRVILREAGTGGSEEYGIEAARAYRDRLVLKLEGIDDAGRAAELRGREAVVLAEDVPELPEGRYWLAHLVGLRVHDENRGLLGRVEDVIETGGGEVLVVTPEQGRDGPPGEGQPELLIPLVRQYVLAVDETSGRVRVRVPDDLLDLNRGGRT